MWMRLVGQKLSIKAPEHSDRTTMDSFKTAVKEATDRAFSECTDITSISLIIAGVLVKLRCTDIDLASAFSGALTHHIAPESLVADWREPAIQIRIWSAMATGVPRPAMPEEIRQRIVARRANLVPDADYQMDFDPTGHMLTVMDPSSQTIDVCINKISELPEWERATPLRSALGWVLRRHNLHLVHSAAVANEHGAALLLGAGGAGKSCASLRCWTEGLGFLGDDICVIGSTSGSSANVYNIYGTAKTLWSDHQVFPDLNPYLVTDPVQRSYKAVYALNKIPNHQIVDSRKLRTLILLDSNHPIGWAERVNPSRVVSLVASTTASFLPGSGRTMLSALSEIARRVPVIRLSVGEDPAQVAELIGAAIDSSRANRSDPYAA
jgi:hypothetical protein